MAQNSFVLKPLSFLKERRVILEPFSKSRSEALVSNWAGICGITTGGKGGVHR
jgi:hypothetical protein